MRIFDLIKLDKQLKREKFKATEEFLGNHSWKIQCVVRNAKTISLLRKLLGDKLTERERKPYGRKK